MRVRGTDDNSFFSHTSLHPTLRYSFEILNTCWIQNDPPEEKQRVTSNISFSELYVMCKTVN